MVGGRWLSGALFSREYDLVRLNGGDSSSTKTAPKCNGTRFKDDRIRLSTRVSFTVYDARVYVR